MTSEKHVFKTMWGGRSLQIETGQLAKQANGAVLVRYGETAVLSAVVASKYAKDVDFFPLTVNYNEKMYAAGKIPGGFIKRENRPSEHATLTARMIDRPIRPLFPDGFRNEIQITNMVMSDDPDCSPEMAAMLGTSIALSISDIPFDGPIAGVQIGYINNEYIINPTVEQLSTTEVSITVAGTKQAINMVESGAKEASEELMLEGLMFGHQDIQELVDFQMEIVNAIGKPKMMVELNEQTPELANEISDAYLERMKVAIQTKEKQAREENIQAVKDDVIERYETLFAEDDKLGKKMKEIRQILEDMEKNEVRRQITIDKIRPDGRKLDEIRPLSSEVGILPRAHGSGLFTRGQTQALSVLTLGPLSDHQIIDGLGLEETKRFMHHYNFPQFSVGETGRSGAPGRREIGHGALGERALAQVLPSEEMFPYTIRLVAEVLESNGSSSQASICAGTLALMDGGVPIKAPVAGIAMGLVKTGDDYTILTDIQGLEDHLGDMDFKVAGTKQGITALQMDIKVAGVTREILTEALIQAKRARLQILDEIISTLPEPRKGLSQYAPKIDMIKINPDKIKIIIGKGGDTINDIIKQTGVKIDISDDGNISIASADTTMIEKAKEIIADLTRDIEIGQVYMAKVKRIEKFGAMVELTKGKTALVHISQLANERVAKVEDVVHLNDELLVKVTEIDNQGRINASRKAMLPK